MGNVLVCDAEKALANATVLCFKFASNACLAGTSSKLEMYTSWFQSYVCQKAAAETVEHEMAAKLPTSTANIPDINKEGARV